MGNSRLQSEIAEGTFKTNSAIRAAYNEFSNSDISLFPVFQKFVVLEVFNSPSELTTESLDSIQSAYGELTNFEFSRSMPRNSIIAKPVLSDVLANRADAATTMILYPFFPSHLAIPCKAGEHVWVVFESLTEKKSIGYWICRIVGSQHIDDVNHSHAPREYDNSFNPTFSPETIQAINELQEPTKPRFHFKNGIFINVLNENEEPDQIVNADSQYILTKQDFVNAYENIILNSNAASLEVREPIPRFKKRPGDLALEGSNNSLIVLGRDRFENYGPNSLSSGNFSAETAAGAIDIVVGRGSGKKSADEEIVKNEQGTSGKIVNNDLGEQELDKFITNLEPLEGDPDTRNDRSRIMISQRTSPDAALGLDLYNKSNFGPATGDNSEGDAAIVLKTDKVRIVARSDIQLLVKGFSSDEDVNGNPIKDESDDSTKYASITIKSNGDIVFTPSKLGYIKLGGDDANRGIVCSDFPVTPTGGGIVGGPLLTTMGGQFAGAKSANSAGNLGAIAPSLGTYANKVLIK